MSIQDIDKQKVAELEAFIKAFGYQEQTPVRITALPPEGINLPVIKRTVTRNSLRANSDGSGSNSGGSDDDDIAELIRLNETYGIYLTVNEGGDKDADITRFAACFVESDTKSLPEQHAALDASPLEPSFRAETKKSVHGYWTIEGDCNEQQWRDAQQRLIAHFDGDRAIKNPARLMRLPGFDHLSVDSSGEIQRKRVEITHKSGRRYTIEQIFEAFPQTEREQLPLAAQSNARFTAGLVDRERDKLILREVFKALAFARCDSYADWRDICYGTFNHFGDDSEVFASLEDWSRQSAKFKPGDCRARWNEASQRGINESRIGFGSLIAWAKEDNPAFVEWYENFNGQTRLENHKQRGANGWLLEALSEKLPRTDLGNSRRFVLYIRGNIYHDFNRNKWRSWDGTRWVEGASAIIEAAKEMVRYELPKEAKSIEDEGKRKEFYQHIAKSQSARAIKAMIDLARSESEIQADTSEFDTQPHLINVSNGALDLRTGELRPHRREDFLTKLIPIAYDPHANCPKTDAFLHRIFAGNKNLIAYFWLVLGYILTGETGEHAVFIFYGTGKNGKSVAVNLIFALLGPYGTSIKTEALMAHRFTGASGHNEDIANLRGMRFVAAVETDIGQRFNESQLKQLTGGDLITASRKHEHNITFRPDFKLVIQTNHKPTVEGTDFGFWRRIKLMPFNETILNNEQDAHLIDKLKAELPGVLTRAVQGSIRYYANDGLGTPPEVAEATEEYRAEQDTLGMFIADKCDLGDGPEVTFKDIYDVYTMWCESRKERPKSSKFFAASMRARGFKSKRTKRGNVWQAIGIRPLRTQSGSIASHSHLKLVDSNPQEQAQ